MRPWIAFFPTLSLCLAALALPQAGASAKDAAPQRHAIPVQGKEQDLFIHHYPATSRVEAGPQPAVLAFHGGGWRDGGPDTLDAHARAFAEAGYSVFVVAHRLAREGRGIKDTLADAFHAADWLHQNAEPFGVDPDRIHLLGESSGGHLAAAVAMLPPTGTDLSGPFPDLPSWAGIALWNPILDLTPIKWLDAAIAPPEERARLSPINALKGWDAVPVLILHGDEDEIVPPETAQAFAKAASALKAPVRLDMLRGKGHAFVHGEEGNGAALSNTAREAIHRSVTFWQTLSPSHVYLAGDTEDDCRIETLHEFRESEGHQPFGSPLYHEGKLYGGTHRGGQADAGTVYAFDLDTGSLSVIHHFKPPQGEEPFGGLLLRNGRLFGATKFGGDRNQGTLYSLDPTRPESGVTIHHAFANASGNLFGPNTPISGGDGFLYGTAFHGGSARWSGGIWRIDTETDTFEILDDLNPETGQHPTGALLDHDGWLWGTTSGYERNKEGDFGGIFRIRADGSGFEVVHRFGGGGLGAHPYDALSAGPDGWLWGTTYGDFHDPMDRGTVFRIHPESLTLQTVIDFAKHPQAGSKPNGGILFGDDGRGFFVTHGSLTGGDLPGSLLELNLTPPNNTGTELPPDGFLRIHQVFDSLDTGITPMRSLATDGAYLFGVTSFGGREYGASGADYLPPSSGTLYRLEIPVRSRGATGASGSNHCSQVGESNGGTPSNSRERQTPR